MTNKTTVDLEKIFAPTIRLQKFGGFIADNKSIPLEKRLQAVGEIYAVVAAVNTLGSMQWSELQVMKDHLAEGKFNGVDTPDISTTRFLRAMVGALVLSAAYSNDPKSLALHDLVSDIMLGVSRSVAASNIKQFSTGLVEDFGLTSEFKARREELITEAEQLYGVDATRLREPQTAPHLA